jgi:hypothetical protein
MILANGTLSPGCDAMNNQQPSLSSSAPTLTVTATASSSNCAAVATSPDSTVSSGAIAGLIVLSAVAVLSIAWAIWESRARRRQRNEILKSDNRHGEASIFPLDAQFGPGFYPTIPEMEAPARHEICG